MEPVVSPPAVAISPTSPGTAPELRKAQREVEAFHRFRELAQRLLEVNEKICRARPVEESLTPQEKKRRKPSNRKSLGK